MSGIARRIQDYEHSFSMTEKRIADYLQENAENAVLLSIHQLAKETGVSSSSLTRFVHKLGYGSYGEMRVDLVRSADETAASDFQEVMEWMSSSDQFLQQYLMSVNNVCYKAWQINGAEKLREIAQLIKQSSVVYLFGVGASALVAKSIEEKLVKLRKRTIFNFDADFGVQVAHTVNPEDLVIAISYGGLTEDVTMAVRNAKDKGCKVIAVTRLGRTPLSKMADINLFVPNVEQVTRITGLFSRYAQLMMIDIIFLYLVELMEADPQQLLQNYRKIMSPLREYDPFGSKG